MDATRLRQVSGLDIGVVVAETAVTWTSVQPRCGTRGDLRLCMQRTSSKPSGEGRAVRQGLVRSGEGRFWASLMCVPCHSLTAIERRWAHGIRVPGLQQQQQQLCGVGRGRRAGWEDVHPGPRDGHVCPCVCPCEWLVIVLPATNYRK
jgi:hypothetical protein